MSSPTHSETETCWYLAPNDQLLRYFAPIPFPEVITPKKDVELIRHQKLVSGKLETLYTFRETTEAEIEKAWLVMADVSRARCPQCGSVNLHKVVVLNLADEFPSKVECLECQWSAHVGK